MIPPAKIGRESNSSLDVTIKHHTKRDVVIRLLLIFLYVLHVVTKLILATRDLIPAKCKEKIAESTAILL